MTVSMRVMSAGDGYKYLLKTIAAADGDRSLSTPLTRYYAEAGTPPGRWIGAGVAALSNGELSVGDRVSEAQLQLLIGMGRDPITGNPLGLVFPTYKTTPERIESRVAALDPSLTPGAKGEAVAQIVAEETARGCSHPDRRNRRGWRGCTGRRHRAHRHRVRSLRLPRR